ncbi:MAG: hypothetical protein R6V27_04255 [Balneolaceae bacterium]
MMKRLLIVLAAASLLLTACGEESNEMDSDLPLDAQVDLLIEQNEYETALDVLAQEDSENEEVALLLEKTHLNYGLYSMNTFDETEMRTRMNNALLQFTEVLKINPNNSVARENIEQIMGIYATIPDRNPEEEVLEGLREVGFDY